MKLCVPGGSLLFTLYLLFAYSLSIYSVRGLVVCSLLVHLLSFLKLKSRLVNVKKSLITPERSRAVQCVAHCIAVGLNHPRA